MKSSCHNIGDLVEIITSSRIHSTDIRGTLAIVVAKPLQAYWTHKLFSQVLLKDIYLDEHDFKTTS